jgi:hypothetical protein
MLPSPELQEEGIGAEEEVRRQKSGHMPARAQRVFPSSSSLHWYSFVCLDAGRRTRLLRVADPLTPRGGLPGPLRAPRSHHSHD